MGIGAHENWWAPYPKILDDAVVGEHASARSRNAEAMLQRIVDGKWLEAHGAIGFWPANGDGKEILVLHDPTRQNEPFATLAFLRQQAHKSEGRPHLCLADFVAPAESGLTDYIGGFAVTASTASKARLPSPKRPMMTTT